MLTSFQKVILQFETNRQEHYFSNHLIMGAIIATGAKPEDFKLSGSSTRPLYLKRIRKTKKQKTSCFSFSNENHIHFSQIVILLPFYVTFIWKQELQDGFYCTFNSQAQFMCFLPVPPPRFTSHQFPDSSTFHQHIFIESAQSPLLTSYHTVTPATFISFSACVLFVTDYQPFHFSLAIHKVKFLLVRSNVISSIWTNTEL